ncbi:MAG: adenylyltransferase/cytidyltransferase family protein [Candidatus Paceibacterota bacterium]
MVKKIKSTKKPKVVAVSGGFDPVHVGHVRMFKEAKKLGDKLVVILNNDNWLKLKKGYFFMPQKERKEILEAFRAVDKVVLTKHKPGTKDISIGKALMEVKPDIFAKGGDRNAKNIPTIESAVCEKIGCKIVNNMGRGGKVQSSSWLLAKYIDKINNKKLKKSK